MKINTALGPEEKFNRDLLYVLQRIKGLILYSDEGHLKYSVHNLIAGGYPMPEEEVLLIKKLRDLEAIEIVNDFSKNYHDESLSCTIKIIQPGFDTIYKKYSRLATDSQKEEKGSSLVFSVDSGEAGYREATKIFRRGTKGFALLNFLSKSQNTGFNVLDIQKFCNQEIQREEVKFRTEKDINDTIREIRAGLEVKKSESFPIQQRTIRGEKHWIWAKK